MPLVDLIAPSKYDLSCLKIPKYSTVTPEAALVIDNGSYQCRVGWSSQKSPSMIFDNYIQKYQLKKDSTIVYGLGSKSIPNNSSKLIQRTAFDESLVCQFEVMELEMDGILSCLGCDSSYPLERPIIMTEPLLNPKYSRSAMTELVLEGYGASKVSYGVDALFSYYYHCKNGFTMPDGIIVSSGHYNTHVLPILNNQVDTQSMKRLSVGGHSMNEYFLRLMQCKYPSFPLKMTFSQAENAIHQYSSVSQDYKEELKKFETQSYLLSQDIPLQYPHAEDETVDPEKVEEEQQKLAEKKKQFSVKMKEQAEIKRLEKLALTEEEVTALRSMKDRKDLYTDDEDYIDMLKSFGYTSEMDFLGVLKEYEDKLQHLRNKIAGVEEVPKEKEAYNFDLLSIPDTELADEKIKEKRRLKLIKASMDAREKQKQEKEQERKRLETLAEQEAKHRQDDFEGWLQQKRSARSALQQTLQKIQKQKENLQDRRSFASTQRLKSLSSLLGDDEPLLDVGGGPHKESKNKKQRKSGTGGDDELEEGFGDDEKDWSMYHLLSKEADSETEESLENELLDMEEQLAKYDPDFFNQSSNLHTVSGLAAQPSKYLPFTEGQSFESQTTKTTAEWYQLHMNIERIRVPEVLFQPSLIGLESMGLTELLDDTLKRYTDDQQQKIVQNVFVTGGNTLYPGFVDRLTKDLLAIRPFQSSFKVHQANNPVYDSWFGAVQWYLDSQRDAHTSNLSWITKKTFEEQGYEYAMDKMVSFFLV